MDATQQRRGSLRSALDVLTSVAMIAAAIMLIYQRAFLPTATDPLTPEVPSNPLSIADLPLRGSPSAEVVMVVFSDFECPFCGRFSREVLPHLERAYIETGQVALAFRHLPLPNHKQAVPAAVAAECAGKQGQFWAAHDQLFADNGLSQERLAQISDGLSVDRSKFNDCLTDQTVTGVIDRSVSEAAVLRVRSTPTFFIGARQPKDALRVSRVISGALPLHEFEKALNAALAGGASWLDRVPFFRKIARPIGGVS